MKYLICTEDEDLEDNSLWPLEVQITRDHSSERGRALESGGGEEIAGEA